MKEYTVLQKFQIIHYKKPFYKRGKSSKKKVKSKASGQSKSKGSLINGIAYSIPFFWSNCKFKDIFGN